MPPVLPCVKPLSPPLIPLLFGSRPALANLLARCGTEKRGGTSCTIESELRDGDSGQVLESVSIALSK